MVAKQQIREAFSRRLNQACDNAGVRSHGRAVDIREALKARGVSATTTAIGKWLNSQSMPEPDKLRPLAEWLGVREEWLEYGRGAEKDSAQMGNAHPIGYHENKMPLVSAVAAGKWCESPDTFAPGDAEEWLPRQPGLGARAFALRVEGDSMTSPYPGQRSYPHGCIIYVDPDKAVTNGCRVVARTPDGTYTFKTYSQDAGRHYLKPINPQYPMIEITDNIHICGVVTGTYIPD